MATAKQKLSAPKGNSSAGLSVQVPPPSVRMRMPEIKIPEIKIPEIKVGAADMQPVAKAIGEIGQAITQLANMQTQCLQMMYEHHKMLGELVKKEATVNVAAPKVTVQRPAGDFYVELDKDGSETVGMRITRESSH